MCVCVCLWSESKRLIINASRASISRISLYHSIANNFLSLCIFFYIYFAFDRGSINNRLQNVKRWVCNCRVDYLESLCSTLCCCYCGGLWLSIVISTYTSTLICLTIYVWTTAWRRIKVAAIKWMYVYA